jgi:hypothetical protein
MDIEEARRFPDHELQRMLESEDEDEREEGRQIQIWKLAIAKAQRENAADSDAVIGLLGAIIFNFGGLTGFGLAATGLGILMFLVLVFGVPRQRSLRTFLVGIPALFIFGIGIVRFAGLVAALF